MIERGSSGTLLDFYATNFGPQGSKGFINAQKNFCSSLAAYSLVSYVLQLKDRHNANILVDRDGHLVHIDFGFMLTNSPLKGMKLENAPFKFTSEFAELMGGDNSEGFNRFRRYFQL